jgi:hypothetical protein
VFARDLTHHAPTRSLGHGRALQMLSGDMLAVMVAVLMSITMCTLLGFVVEANRPHD